MPGSWVTMPTICSSRRTVAYASCNSWADEGSSQCSQWADEGSNQCSHWADEGSNQCSSWADQGHNQCCDWAPCSWFCDAFYWVANLVCQGWYWVANLVCQAWYWVANLVCQAWFWIARWVCLAWTWIFYVFCFSGNGGAAFLLTDGSILMNESSSGYGTRRWWKLAPDSAGNYAGGTWIRVHDSLNARKYFASAVMADGRLVVCGGEYSDSSGSNQQDETNLCEIYNPVADTWTALPSPTGLTQVGDAPCSMLPDGRFLIGDINSTKTFTLDPAATAWTQKASKASSPSEESWALVPDGTIITVETQNTPNAEKYLIASDQWTSAGALPANIVETASSEIGPAILLTDGRVFFVGAAGGVTAIYTPGAVSPWSPGPAIPAVSRRGQAQGAKDGPAALEPGGKVLFPVAPVDGTTANYLSPCTFFEFDGTNLTTVSNPPNSNCPPYVGRLLVLPSGDIFWAREDDSAMYLFQSTDTPHNAWRPVITSPSPSFPVFLGATITVSGTQFNGLSQAVGYGDDYTAATNYPIVRIRNSQTGHVRYCRTANHQIGATPSMGVATGAATVSTHVTIPADLEIGPSQLFVVANGIPSNPLDVLVRRRG